MEETGRSMRQVCEGRIKWAAEIVQDIDIERKNLLSGLIPCPKFSLREDPLV
jgi:hypothetical protein